MNVDLFLGEKRWEILKIISNKPSSPIEIAEKLMTTVSYVSQQLKLLEVAGLVLKKKTGFFEKGKPRNLYYLSKEFLHFSILSKEISVKKLLNLDDIHKGILNIWLLQDTSLHYPMQKLFWKLQENLSLIQAIFLEGGPVPKMIILSESRSLKTKIESYVKSFEKRIDFSFIDEKNLLKLDFSLISILHDPQGTVNNLKGGEVN